MEEAILANPYEAAKDTFITPAICNHALRYSEDPARRNGPFYLTARDFGLHNVLVNDNYDILALIDLDSVMAAPLEVAAQNPITDSLGEGPPPWLLDRELVPRQTRTRPPKYLPYVDLLKDAEDEWNSGGEGRNSFLANAVTSSPAMIFSGLLEYGRCVTDVNYLWMRAYIHMLRIDVRNRAQLTVLEN